MRPIKGAIDFHETTTSNQEVMARILGHLTQQSPHLIKMSGMGENRIN